MARTAKFLGPILHEGGANYSQYCWPLKTKHAAFGEGCDAATRLRQATLRRGAGPYLLECMTFRMAGHYVGDSQQYRSKQELAESREKCPIERLRRQLVGLGVPAEELDAIGQGAKIEVLGAVERARAALPPDPATVLEFVYGAPALAAIRG